MPSLQSLGVNMAKPIYTVIIDIHGVVTITERSKVPFLKTKGTSMHRAIKMKEQIDA